MKLVFDTWNGTAPKYHPEQLAAGMAVVAENTKPGRNILEAWQAPLLKTGVTNDVPTNTTHMFLYNPPGVKVWFTSNSMAEWADPAIPNDNHRFVVKTDLGYPKFTTFDSLGGVAPYPNAYFRLGMGYPDAAVPGVSDAAYADNDSDRDKIPEWADAVAQGADTMPVWDKAWEGTGVVDDLSVTSTEYKITFVDKYGRESAGSIPTARFGITIYKSTLKQFPRITLPAAMDAAHSDVPPIDEGFFRIYRSNTGSLGSVFQFVTDLPMNRHDTTWVDATLSADLGEAISTDAWISPPDDDAVLYPNGPMRNALAHPGGFIVGHTKHEIVFSEPYTVHAYPSGYRQSFAEEIVGIVLNGNSVFVGTNGTPMILTGVHPKSMSPVRLSDPYPAVSSEGMTEVGNRVFFVSSTALIAVSGSTAENVSAAYFTDDQWVSMEPETMRLSYYDSRLFIFTKNHGTLVFNPTAPAQGFRTNTIKPKAFYNTPADGILNFYDGGATGKVLEFGRDTSSTQDYRYESRVVKSLSPVGFNCCKVIANDYATPVTFTLHGRSESGYQVDQIVEAPSAKWFYLPNLPRCERWHISIAGSSEVRIVELATNPKELN